MAGSAEQAQLENGMISKGQARQRAVQFLEWNTKSSIMQQFLQLGSYTDTYMHGSLFI